MSETRKRNKAKETAVVEDSKKPNPSEQQTSTPKIQKALGKNPARPKKTKGKKRKRQEEESEQSDASEESPEKRQKVQPGNASEESPEKNQEVPKKYVPASSTLLQFKAKLIKFVVQNEANPEDKICYPIYRIDCIPAKLDEKSAPKRKRGTVLFDLDKTLVSADGTILNKDQLIDFILYANENDFDIACVTARVFADELAYSDYFPMAEKLIQMINIEVRKVALTRQMANVDLLGIQSIYFTLYLCNLMQPNTLHIPKVWVQHHFHMLQCHSNQRPLSNEEIQFLKDCLPLLDDMKPHIDQSRADNFPAFLMTEETDGQNRNLSLLALRNYLDKLIERQNQLVAQIQAQIIQAQAAASPAADMQVNAQAASSSRSYPVYQR